MQKLKSQDRGVIRYMLLLPIYLLLINCSNKTKENQDDNYKIDLSVKYNNEINTFQIEEDGNALVLIQKFEKSDEYYKVTFNQKEMDYIQKLLNQINYSNCDSINTIIFDGTQYFCNLTKKNEEINIVSNTCKQLKPFNKIVKYIVETYRKKMKLKIFKSLKFIKYPPSPPTL